MKPKKPAKKQQKKKPAKKSTSQPKKKPTKKSKPPQVDLPQRTPAELIHAIPAVPDYDPLPYREINQKYFEMLAVNTNRYAKLKNAGSEGMRSWSPTNSIEVKVFIAIFIYMGVVRLPSNGDYWSSKYGVFFCAQHMSLNRFENLKRYFHVSNPTPKETEDNDSCMQYRTPGINLSIDEMMVRFFGRSKNTFKAPNKPIKEGYKIFALCEAGYTCYFMWSSKSDSYGELQRQPDLSPTESMVYQLARTLPKNIPYVLYMDNLFTRGPSAA
ncbi:hypothetical protein Egran_06098 [Elaphomyces granulatus]|uniref:PiggyBac transposable element-derived protein domain-containing protein n=1 Tax=Elaphomyces granulatus TaxID=519963 RepID=A0A232LPY5_9EURO|nr:hypothetical protein Egran_06098 [Elaphomyces granulatus]